MGSVSGGRATTVAPYSGANDGAKPNIKILFFKNLSNSRNFSNCPNFILFVNLSNSSNFSNFPNLLNFSNFQNFSNFLNFPNLLNYPSFVIF